MNIKFTLDKYNYCLSMKESARNHLNESLNLILLRYEVAHLHNLRPWAVVRAVDQSRRAAPSDQSQQW